jgi:hypothetical protein
VSHQRKHPYRPTLEGLEERIVPYALAGVRWANVNVSASFAPDKTLIFPAAVSPTGAPVVSNLFGSLGAHYPAAVWQHEYARALQTWADVTPLNFHFVSDDGSPAADSNGSQVPNYGQIRFFGYAIPYGYSGMTNYPDYAPYAGCSFLATQDGWTIDDPVPPGASGTPDLYSIILHETGHALGLLCSTDPSAVMYQSVSDFTGLSPDDVAGIQAIYGAHPTDPIGHSLTTATPLTLNSSSAVTLSGDLSSVSDLDYYRVTAPASFDGTMSVSVDARNLSLLIPKVSVYDATGHLLGSANAGTDYGSVATLSLGGLTPGQTYYLVADGATTDVFGMGAYKLQAKFGGITIPPSAPSLAIDNVALTPPARGTNQFLFTATLSAASSSSVTVNYATANGTAAAARDYVTTNGTLTFDPGQTQGTIAVTVNAAATSEPDKTFYVMLSNPTNATLDVAEGMGTIQKPHLAPDRYEANNTVRTATKLGEFARLRTGSRLAQRVTRLVLTGLTIHNAADVDWFQFIAATSGTFRVSITFSQVWGTGGHLDVGVLNRRLTVLAQGQSDTGRQTLMVRLVAGHRYYLRLKSPTHSLFRYNLAITPSSGGAAT